MVVRRAFNDRSGVVDSVVTVVSSFFSRSKSHDDDRSKKTRSREAAPDSADVAEARNSEVKSGASKGSDATDGSRGDSDERTKPLSPNDELIDRRHAVAKWRQELDAITKLVTGN